MSKNNKNPHRKEIHPQLLEYGYGYGEPLATEAGGQPHIGNGFMPPGQHQMPLATEAGMPDYFGQDQPTQAQSIIQSNFTFGKR